MIDFIEYIVSELKQKRLSKGNALSLIKQFSQKSSTKAVQKAIHPLLHTNTSDFYQQRYSTVFNGSEPFLSDHQVRLGESNYMKILPGVAYLEMANAAVENALPNITETHCIELKNVVWMQPFFVNGDKEIHIALLTEDEENIQFEIYSNENEDQEIIHCKGDIQYAEKKENIVLDIEKLTAKMQRSELQMAEIYKTYDQLGLQYGETHQVISKIYQGTDELIAKLVLSDASKSTKDVYTLHHGMLDGALQASLGLVDDLANLSGSPMLPFALESIQIVEACTNEMNVWIRYSEGAKSTDTITKLDIDVCDADGMVCAQLSGFTSKTFAASTIKTMANSKASTVVYAEQIWKETKGETADIAFEHHEILFYDFSKKEVQAIENKLSNVVCNTLEVSSDKNIAEIYEEVSLQVFEKVQAIIQKKLKGKVNLQLVFKNTPENQLLTGIVGLLKTASLENPKFSGQVIFTDQHISEQIIDQLRFNQTNYVDTVVKYEHNTRYVWQLKAVDVSTSEPAICLKENGVYVITGGFGGLGIIFTKEILKQTPKATIILTGRSELTTTKEAKLKELTQNGGKISYRQLDLSSETEVHTFITSIKEEFHQLNGIIHAAGMTADNFILKKTNEEFTAVLTPKVIGTYHLSTAIQESDVDFMLLFSSGVAALGNAGQADYALANGFLDQFANYQNKQQSNTKYIAVNWPLWKDGGMGLQTEMLERMEQETGVRPLQTVNGLTAFHRALSLTAATLFVLEGDAQKIHTLLFEKPVVEVVQKVTEATQKEATTADKSDNLLEKTSAYLRKEFSSVLKISLHKIDTRAALERYGIDSVVAMNLTGKLEKIFGTLPKTLFFEYQTIDELSEYIAANFQDKLQSLFSIEKTAKTSSIQSVVKKIKKEQIPTRTRTQRRKFKATAQHQNSYAKSLETVINEPIAIVGLSGRYPESIDVETYWNNLKNGKDCVTEVPAQRWDWRDFYSEDTSNPGTHTSKWGGFISGVDEFDPRFFNISPREASYIDPQERLFLQHAWTAIEDAGYTRQTLQIPTENDLPAQIGVYVGVMYGEYNLSGSLASIANRVSYFLNLHGPSMTLDTMCSSSLTAIHLACQDIKLGRTKMAIAGGVNVSIDANKYSMLSTGQFISSDGHCQSFGEGGDGYIPGEGVGAVILKRLSDAEKDKDHIYGIIKGTALNHGGKTNGYTVPNPNAQAAAISRALRESNTDPKHISYVEAHGTGTKLGDPIEIAALTKAYKIAPENSHCLVGSSKSNIGHCESAAGIAGFTKVLLQMKHKQIVPSLHSKRLNPNIDFEKTPFEINQTLRNWEKPVIAGRTIPRLAGLSSFGAGGSNAHIILQEYESATTDTYTTKATEILVPLSARIKSQLQQKATDLLAFIKGNKQKINVLELAYTLQVGREAMNERVGFIVTSIEDLIEKLEAFVKGETEVVEIYRGQVHQNKETISLFNSDKDFQETINKWIDQKKYAKVIDLWVKGLELDWNSLYGDEKIQRISLPTYPFAKEKYWNAPELRGKVLPQTQNIATVHPLLHMNTSNFDQLRFTTTFSGKEFFVKDYQLKLNGTGAQKALPALASLEMARAAAEYVKPVAKKMNTLTLKAILWGKPFILTTNHQFHIVLEKENASELYFEIASQQAAIEIIHAQGQAVYEEAKATVQYDLAKLQNELATNTKYAQEIYTAFAIMGLYYGTSNQVIQKVYTSKNVLLAETILPQSIENSLTDFVLHPSMLDSVVQAAICLVTDLKLSENYMYIPVALDELTLYRSFTKKMFVLVQYAEHKAVADSVAINADFCDENGIVCAQLKGLQLQQIQLDRTIKQQPIALNIEALSAPIEFLASKIEKPNDVQLRELSTDILIEAATILPKPNNIDLRQTNIVQKAVAHEEKPVLKKIRLEDVSTTNDAPKIRKITIPEVEPIASQNDRTEVKVTPVVTKKAANTNIGNTFSKESLKQMFINTLADALYLEPHEIDADQSFIDIGLDSIVGVEWIKTINKKLEMELSSTKIYDYATINALAKYVYSELQQQQRSFANVVS